MKSSMDRLRLEQGTEKAKHPERVLNEVLVETKDGVRQFQWPRSKVVSLLTWTTG